MTELSVEAEFTGRCVFSDPHVKKALWEVTDFCPLQCSYCSMSSGPSGARNFPLERAPAALRSLQALQVCKLVFSGGEPFAYRPLPQLLGLGVESGFDVSVSTSGAGLRESVVRASVDAGLCKVTVGLDGWEAVHDANRGQGSFRRAQRAVEILHRHGLRLTANCVMAADDLGDIESRVDYISTLPFDEIVVCRQLPRGRSAPVAPGLAPARVASEWHRLASAPVPWASAEQRIRVLAPECDASGCPSGTSIFHVDLEGNVRKHCVYKLPQRIATISLVASLERRL